MQKAELASKLGITPKRLATIVNALFDGEKLVFAEDEIAQVKGVIEYMRQKNEASVRKAVEQYKSSSELTANVNHRSNSSLMVKTGKQEAGITQLSQQHFEIAKQRALKQAVAIQETSQILLANFLEDGIPLDELSELDLEVLEVAGEKVYDAALGKYDAVGNYLPALVQPAKMLSAAID